MLLDLFQAENTKGLMKGRVGCSFLSLSCPKGRSQEGLVVMELLI